MDLHEKIHQTLVAFDGSTSLQVAAVMHLITPENVELVLEELPEDFRMVFMAWVRGVYQPGGERISIGRGHTEPPLEGIAAVLGSMATTRA